MQASGRLLASQLFELPCQTTRKASAAYSTTAEPAQAGSSVGEGPVAAGALPHPEQQRGERLSQAEPSGSGRGARGCELAPAGAAACAWGEPG